MPGAERGEHMWLSEGQVDGARSMGTREGEPSVDAWDVEEGEA